MLTTQRLRLEPLDVRHTADVVAYRVRNREYLAAHEPMRAAEYYTETYQAAAIARAVADNSCARFLVFERDRSQMIGSFDLLAIRRGIVQDAVIGYSMDEAHAGRGFATEAAGALVRYAFDVLVLHRLHTSYEPGNDASGRVLVKNGFRVEGYAREYLFLNGAWRDAILVARTNPRFTWPT